MEITVLKNVLDKNMDQADENRRLLLKNNVHMINMISSPGAGKTAILERSIPLLSESFRIAVVEGDAYTSRDAERLQSFQVPIVQINTEGGCHLDSHSISKALQELDLKSLDLVLVENVGNLICPTSFDLGEHTIIAVLSTAEGEDKPAKYPMLFRKANCVILNKTDLLPFVEFDMASFYRDINNLHPGLRVFETSATRNKGISEWSEWLADHMKRGR